MQCLDILVKYFLFDESDGFTRVSRVTTNQKYYMDGLSHYSGANLYPLIFTR